MAVIDVSDVATVAGRPISDAAEVAQVTQWIDDVEMLLTARLGDLADRDQALLAYVEREAVVARMRYKDDRNSQGATGGSDETDDGLEHYFLRILDPWWALLDPSDSGSAAFSVRPYFEADSTAYAINAWEIG